MRKIFAIFLFSVFCFGAELREGVDYETLKTPILGAEKSVIEIFNYACPFCYKYEKITPQIARSLPKDAVFKAYHLWRNDDERITSEVLAVAMIKDEADGVSIFSADSAFYKAKSAYFVEYHEKRTQFDREKFLQIGLKASGIAEKDFKNALQNQKVIDLLKAWEAGYEAARVQGIPAFVVNGKYLILASAIKSAQDLVDKINILLEK
ncbi:thiol:disulfide interchange protein DsbA/DsbL [Helicobacter sp. 23-1045]